MSLYPPTRCTTCGRYELTSCRCEPESEELVGVSFANLEAGKKYHVDHYLKPNPFNATITGERTDCEVLAEDEQGRMHWLHEDDKFYELIGQEYKEAA